ncbi:MAG: hypothetical protein AB2L14_16040 [Candidatus Xenobiia bacterium LiM19]
MTYERKVSDDHFEVVDDSTQEVVAKKYRFTARKPCVLCSERFNEGEMIEVLFPVSLDLEGGKGDGPWEPGSYSSKWFKNNAVDIVELKTGITIHRAPYTKRFLGKANRSARYHALKSILTRFMGKT